MDRVTVVVPCFNEERRLDVEAFVTARLADRELELVFVDDGSTDGTRRVLEEIRARRGGPTTILAQPTNAGKAAAVRRGVLDAIERRRGLEGAVGFWDADLATPLSELAAFVDVLEQRPEVDVARLGGIGFCFGGSTVLQLARSGADLKGVVNFHGALSTKAPAKAGSVKAAILSCTGADDPMIPADQVVAFEEEMRAAKADWQVNLYGNTLHSFTNPEADGSLNPAILYHEKTDKRSWTAMRDFFQEKFGA